MFRSTTVSAVALAGAVALGCTSYVTVPDWTIDAPILIVSHEPGFAVYPGWRTRLFHPSSNPEGQWELRFASDGRAERAMESCGSVVVQRLTPLGGFQVASLDEHLRQTAAFVPRAIGGPCEDCAVDRFAILRGRTTERVELWYSELAEELPEGAAFGAFAADIRRWYSPPRLRSCN